MSDIVTRTFGIDFIFFDLIFLAAWIFLLIRKRYYSPLRWGIAGWLIYLLVDYLLWYRIMGSRHYEGPINPNLFFLWFCFSPGFVQFSFVIIMFEKRNTRELIFWTVLFYAGWTLVGLLSQWIHLDDTLIRVCRDMGQGNQRWIMGGLAVLNLLIGILLVWIKQVRWKDLLYLFLVGTLVELALELSMLASGIRLEQGHWSPGMMAVNTLIEFNCGIVTMYLLWALFNKKNMKAI
jgi:hypothetical protein